MSFKEIFRQEGSEDYAAKKEVMFKEHPTVFITPRALQKLHAFIDLYFQEISGLGIVEKIGPGKYLITDVFLLKQRNSAGGTEIDSNAIGDMMMDFMAHNKDLSKIKLWWHSHVDMGTFWSGTDWGTARRFNNGWMISIVGNKRHETKVRLDVYEPIPFCVDELGLKLQVTSEDEITRQCKAEIEKNVVGGLNGGGFTRIFGGKSFFTEQTPPRPLLERIPESVQVITPKPAPVGTPTTQAQAQPKTIDDGFTQEQVEWLKEQKGKFIDQSHEPNRWDLGFAFSDKFGKVDEKKWVNFVQVLWKKYCEVNGLVQTPTTSSKEWTQEQVEWLKNKKGIYFSELGSLSQDFNSKFFTCKSADLVWDKYWEVNSICDTRYSYWTTKQTEWLMEHRDSIQLPASDEQKKAFAKAFNTDFRTEKSVEVIWHEFITVNGLAQTQSSTTTTTKPATRSKPAVIEVDSEGFTQKQVEWFKEKKGKYLHGRRYELAADFRNKFEPHVLFPDNEKYQAYVAEIWQKYIKINNLDGDQKDVPQTQKPGEVRQDLPVAQKAPETTQATAKVQTRVWTAEQVRWMKENKNRFFNSRLKLEQHELARAFYYKFDGKSDFTQEAWKEFMAELWVKFCEVNSVKSASATSEAKQNVYSFVASAMIDGECHTFKGEVEAESEKEAIKKMYARNQHLTRLEEIKLKEEEPWTEEQVEWLKSRAYWRYTDGGNPSHQDRLEFATTFTKQFSTSTTRDPEAIWKKFCEVNGRTYVAVREPGWFVRFFHRLFSAEDVLPIEQPAQQPAGQTQAQERKEDGGK